LGGEVFLVDGKTMAGIDFSGMGPHFGVHLDLNFMYADPNAPRENVETDFIGTLLGGHVFIRTRLSPSLEGRIGTGIDAFFLTGIASGEKKLAWPVYGELNAAVTPKIALFFRARYHLASSDGLLVGEDYDGNVYTPILSSLGVSYVF